MSAKVINFANFKGGVGKTTTTTILANILSQFGHNTLVIDFDPQGNASDMLMKTAGLGDEIPKSIFEGIQQQDITDCVMDIKQNLALIPSDFDLIGFPLFLNKTTKNDLMKRAYLLDYLIEPLRSKYDYIIIDTPPTISDYTNNAVVASDYVSIVMQTHPWSFRASKHFIPYLQEMIDEYDTNIHLLGIVPVMLKTDGKMDDYIMRLASQEYKDHMFKSEIKHSERVKRYALSGITNDLIHDKRIKKMYGKLLSEVLERVDQHERRYIEQ